MRIVNILGDGSSYPPLKKSDIVIRIQRGTLSIGRFDRALFLTNTEDYIIGPINVTDIKADVLVYISSVCPGIIYGNRLMHFICPTAIAKRCIWNSIEVG